MAKTAGILLIGNEILSGKITDANAALFDVANGFHGCIVGINEVLARQGLLGGRAPRRVRVHGRTPPERRSGPRR